MIDRKGYISKASKSHRKNWSNHMSLFVLWWIPVRQLDVAWVSGAAGACLPILFLATAVSSRSTILVLAFMSLYKYRILYMYRSNITVINQFRVTIKTIHRTLIHCMNIYYVVGHERANSLRFQRITSVLWELTAVWSEYVKCCSGEWLNIWTWYSLEMVLKFGLDVSFGNM
jgi:hypothetical protein